MLARTGTHTSPRTEYSAVAMRGSQSRLRHQWVRGGYRCHSVPKNSATGLVSLVGPSNHGEPFLWHYFKVREARRKLDEYVLTQLL